MKKLENIGIYDEINESKCLMCRGLDEKRAKAKFEEFIMTLEKLSDSFYYVLLDIKKFELDKGQTEKVSYINFTYLRIKNASVEQERLKKKGYGLN